MRISALLAAGALATAGLAAVPAEAQRYGYGYDGGDRSDAYRDHRDHDRGDRYRRDGGYRGYDDGYRRDHDWRGHDRWERGYHGRPRISCRVVRGYYGPERRCFRTY